MAARGTNNSKRISSIVKKELKKHDNKVVERKYLTTQQTLPAGAGGISSATAGGLRTSLNSLSLGDTEDTYDGRQLTQKRLQIQYELRCNSSAIACPVRVMLVRFQGVTGVPNLADVLEDVSSNSYALISPYRRDPDVKYKILYDHLHLPVYGQNNMLQIKKLSIDLKEYPQKVNEAATQWVQGQIYLMAFGDQATNKAGWANIARFTYTDQ